MKLCVIYNFAQHYRSGIFKLIDQEYDCDWFFGKSMDDVKKMDYSLLRGNVTEVDGWSWHGIDYQKGILGLLKRNYDAYLMLGSTKTISTWRFAIRARVFHPKKRLYFWTHGFYGKESRFEAFIKRVFFKLPTGGSFTYGDYARALMIKQGIREDKLFTIHNSLDYDSQLKLRNSGLSSSIYRDHFKNIDPTIIFIGRFTPIKKLNMLIESVKNLCEQNHFYNLVLVGDGTERENLETLVDDYKLGDRVWFYGACYDERTNAELIYNSDLCVAPGNVGLTAMHTLVFGTPVISHDMFPYQMPEFEAIHPNLTGNFYKQGDVDSLSETINEWFQNNSLSRDEIRQYCYDEIDHYWTPEFQINVIKEHIR